MLGSKKSIVISIIVTILCIAAYFLVPFEGLENNAKGVLLVFIWAVAMWIGRPFDEYIVGIIAAAVSMIFFGAGSQAASGFSGMGWWLTTWAGFMSGVLASTGLGRRLAYTLMVKLGTSPLKSMYATTMACNIMAAVMPSNTARGAVMGGICDNICDGLGYERGKKNGGAALMLANLYANTTNTCLFYTATSSIAIGMDIVYDMTGQRISWIGWLQASFLPILTILFLLPLICYYMFTPKEDRKSKKTVDVTFAKHGLEEMGPMSRNEKSAVIILTATLLLWATESLHGISCNYIAFLMAAALMFPKLGAATYDQVKDYIPWRPLIQLGFAISLANVISDTGGFSWLVDTLFIKTGIANGLSFDQFMLIWMPTVILLHIIFAGMDAMSTILAPVGVAIAQGLGYDPYLTGLLTVMCVVVNANFMPFNSAPNLIFYSYDRYTVNQQLRGSAVLAVMAIVLFVFSFKVWWPMIGVI